jgi:hypothetical protein
MATRREVPGSHPGAPGAGRIGLTNGTNPSGWQAIGRVRNRVGTTVAHAADVPAYPEGNTPNGRF